MKSAGENSEQRRMCWVQANRITPETLYYIQAGFCCSRFQHPFKMCLFELCGPAFRSSHHGIETELDADCCFILII